MRLALMGMFMFLAGISVRAQTVYSTSFNTIDGNAVSMNSYQGSKVLVLLAPSTILDTSRIREIKIFQNAHGTAQVKLVGVMSIEDGYADSNKVAIKAMYQSMGVDIVLTEGMHTRKAAGSNQSPLLHFLTTKSINKRFDMDTHGIGQKFIIDEVGKLFTVVIATVPLLSTPVEQAIARKL